MPLYEYQCDACSHRFEVIQKFSDAPIQECPKCGGKVGKLLSSPAIQFKGSGFYLTDYGRSGSSKTGGSSGSHDSGGAAKGDGKGDTAAAAKTETKADAKPSGDKAAS
ncbi:MAG: FmdB family zinc ribbon protein [Vicinamibacterales bacterium]